jgi:hypothetical protein
MKNIIQLLLFTGITLLISACSKEYHDINISGKAQKGPFEIGSNVTIAELDKDLKPTGKVYLSTITDNDGSFNIPDVDFSSDYIELKVEGLHYHEYAGGTNNTPLTLFSIAKLSQINNFNINILTHLEMDRLIEHFQKGLDFEEAKEKAQSEVLAIFSLDDIYLDNSENLDISQQGDNNAVLLAISVAVQGYYSGASLTSLLTKIRSDLQDNGILDSDELHTQIITQSLLLRTEEIRTNLASFYRGIGKGFEIPDFERYIDTINSRKNYFSALGYSIPEYTTSGNNLLCMDDDTLFLNNSNEYSLAINLGENAKLDFYINLVRMTGDGIWQFINNDNWEIESSLQHPNACSNLYLKSTANADIKVKFTGEGTAHLYYSISSIDGYGDKWVDKTIVWVD